MAAQLGDWIAEMFSKDELRDIFIAIFVLTIIFAYSPNLMTFVYLLPSAFVVVVTSFLLHELAHKFVAVKFGAKAFFKLWPFGLIMGIIFMFIPNLKIVAPGSVVIYTQKFGKWRSRQPRYPHLAEMTIREVGKIAAAGPFINIIIAMISWGLVSSVLPGNQFFTYLTLINAWLAAVNLIPIGPLDGAKIFTWKPWIWIVMIVVSAMFLLSAIPAFIR